MVGEWGWGWAKCVEGALGFTKGTLVLVPELLRSNLLTGRLDAMIDWKRSIFEMKKKRKA